MKNSNIRWGIMGLGKIAHTFASDLQRSKNGLLYGVASRDMENAKAFGEQYRASKYFGSYEELLIDPDVDVVYIATPHVFHHENTMNCLAHGKSVLCEKPLAMNSQEVKTMIKEARSKNLFLMEAMWTRFIPATEKLLDLLNEKVIGDLLFIHADFGFKAEMDPHGRLFNKKLGGGSLMDIGIYPVYLSLLTLGLPTEIKATARYTETGVDSYCAMLFEYETGARAVLESTVDADTPIEATLYGSQGKIKMHRRFHHADKISVYKDHKLTGEWEIPYLGNGYHHEIEEVNRCLLSNKTESDKMPLQTSRDLMEVLDRVKGEIGLSYAD